VAFEQNHGIILWEVKVIMMFQYITLSDETEITHSHILNRNEQKEIEVHFERPTENGFDIARCVLPDYRWISKEGFMDKEIDFFKQLLQNNAHLFYRYAEKGGVNIA